MKSFSNQWGKSAFHKCPQSALRKSAMSFQQKSKSKAKSLKYETLPPLTNKLKLSANINRRNSHTHPQFKRKFILINCLRDGQFASVARFFMFSFFFLFPRLCFQWQKYDNNADWSITKKIHHQWSKKGGSEKASLRIEWVKLWSTACLLRGNFRR